MFGRDTGSTKVKPPTSLDTKKFLHFLGMLIPNHVMFHMGTTRPHFQIVWMVILVVFIFMVDKFTTFQWPTKHQCSNHSVDPRPLIHLSHL